MAFHKATASSRTTSERSVAAVAERATEDVEAPIAAPARPRTDRRSSFDSLESTFSLFLFMLLFPSVADLSRSGLASLITAPLIALVAHSNQRKNRPVFLLHLSYPILSSAACRKIEHFPPSEVRKLPVSVSSRSE